MNNTDLFGNAVPSEVVCYPSAKQESLSLLKDYFGETICPLTFCDEVKEGDVPPDDSGPSHWNADDVYELCYKYLKWSLEILARPGNGDRKHAVLSWIADDDLDDGLSFEVVCGAAGYDSEEIRNRLRLHLKAIGFHYSTRISDYNRIRVGVYDYQDRLEQQQHKQSSKLQNLSLF